MTRRARHAELEVEKRDDYNRYIALKVASHSPDYEAADRVARALIRFFNMPEYPDFRDACKRPDGSLAVWAGDDGANASAVVHYGGRRLFVELPASDFAFDGEAGVALAEARTWLSGGDWWHLDSVERVLETRASLHDKDITEQSVEDSGYVMNEFSIPRFDAEYAAYLIKPWYDCAKEYIRDGVDCNPYQYKRGLLYKIHWARAQEGSFND